MHYHRVLIQTYMTLHMVSYDFLRLGIVIILQNFEIAQILDDLFTSHESISICEWTLASEEVVQVLPIACYQSRAPTFFSFQLTIALAGCLLMLHSYHLC